MTKLERDLAALPENLRMMRLPERIARYNYMAGQLDLAAKGEPWHTGRGLKSPAAFRVLDGRLLSEVEGEVQKRTAAVLLHFGIVPCDHCGRLIGRDEHRSPLFAEPMHFGCGLDAARENPPADDPSPEQSNLEADLSRSIDLVRARKAWGR